ncbi:MAG: hypothetical protein ABIR32_03395, partial [Ilumatobacteraceae bacterium]
MDTARCEIDARSARPDGERFVDDGFDSADADAFEHADLRTHHEEALRQPRSFVVAAFVAHFHRLLVRRASCSVAEVEERFEPVEAVEQLGGTAAAGKELDVGATEIGARRFGAVTQGCKWWRSTSPHQVRVA